LAAAKGSCTIRRAGGSDRVVGVVLASRGYPSRRIGQPIVGIRQAEAIPGSVYHAGTAIRDGQLSPPADVC
jgi:phosphoribosylamine-glycine ligase